MKILVNAATAVVGGGIQVATSFIVNVLNNPHKHEFFFALSDFVANNVKVLMDNLPLNLEVIKTSPARLWKGRKSRATLQRIEMEFKPDIIYSIASPSYVNFRAPEVARFTDAWLTHPSKLAFSQLPLRRVLHMRLLAHYKAWSIRNIRYFHTQTKIAANGLAKRLKLKTENVSAIPNCYNQLFEAQDADGPNKAGRKNTIFVVSYPYPHKNLTIVPDVVTTLNRLGNKFKFVMTMPRNAPETAVIIKKEQQLNVDKQINNVGRLTLDECKKWYSKSYIIFLPTLLETFSVTYLEAMIMKRPIVTTDLDFAHDVCGDAAEYFEPLNVESAAKAILKVATDSERYQELVEKGIEQLTKFPSPEENFRAHISWLEEVVNKVSPK
ncbi:glycosyltransferase [bacterium]|nr:glycosyltransferase [bacterium]